MSKEELNELFGLILEHHPQKNISVSDNLLIDFEILNPLKT